MFRAYWISAFAWFACAVSTGASCHAALVFTFDYSGNTPGVGFLDPVTGAARQNALSTAGTLFSNLFSSHFSNSAALTFSVTSTYDNTASTLASAGSNSVSAPGTYGGAEVVRNKVIFGNDLNGSTADGIVDVNWGYNWELDPNTLAVAPGIGESYDFYAAAFHEFTHALGFGSLISGTPGHDGNGSGAQGSSTPGSWAKWDQFLADASNSSLVNGATFEVNQTAFANAQTNGGFFTGANAVAAYGGRVPLFVDPDVSHLDESTFATPTSATNFMMKPQRDYGPQEARVWSGLEVGILRDLGYTAVPEPSSAMFVLLVLAGMSFSRFKRNHATA